MYDAFSVEDAYWAIGYEGRVPRSRVVHQVTLPAKLGALYRESQEQRRRFFGNAEATQADYDAFLAENAYYEAAGPVDELQDKMHQLVHGLRDLLNGPGGIFQLKDKHYAAIVQDLSESLQRVVLEQIFNAFAYSDGEIRVILDGFHESNMRNGILCLVQQEAPGPDVDAWLKDAKALERYAQRHSIDEIKARAESDFLSSLCEEGHPGWGRKGSLSGVGKNRMLFSPLVRCTHVNSEDGSTSVALHSMDEFERYLRSITSPMSDAPGAWAECFALHRA